METRRTRAKRAGPSSTAPEATRPAHSTRQRVASEEPTATSKTSARADAVKGGSLTKNPIARRGARVPASDTSIPTDPGHEDEDDDDDGAASAAPETSDIEDDAAVQLTVSQRHFMTFNLSNLARAADAVIKRTKYFLEEDDSHFQRQMLDLKMSNFKTLQAIYELPGAPTPFLSHAWTKSDELPLDQRKAAEVALVLANLALALDSIKVTQESKGEVHGQLEVLVTIFPWLFTVGGDTAHSENEALLAVQLRTNCLIESLPSLKTKQEAYEATASMFCAFGSRGDVSARLANGPYKKLTRGANTTADDQLCYDRGAHIISLIKAGKKDMGLASLRKTYPLKETLSSFQEWIFSTYNQLNAEIARSKEAWKSMQSQPDVFHDAQQTRAAESSDSETDAEEDRQPVTRIQSNGESQRTFFHGGAEARLADYKAASSSSGNKRTHSEAFTNNRDNQHQNQDDDDDDDDDDDGEEDAFQTDNRRINPDQIAAAQEYKRQRIALRSPRASPSPRHHHQHHHPSAQISHTQLAPPSSTATTIVQPQHHHNQLSSSPQDLQNLQARKKEAMQAHRTASQSVHHPPSTAHSIRQRTAWSEADSLTLLAMVEKFEGRWSAIEAVSPSPFEHPRNQQAYRDRARNMKVDYLITDSVLPPGFNYVALGKKETMRVISFGKNPLRKEEDIGPRGNVVNSEFIDELHG